MHSLQTQETTRNDCGIDIKQLSMCKGQCPFKYMTEDSEGIISDNQPILLFSMLGGGRGMEGKRRDIAFKVKVGVIA